MISNQSNLSIQSINISLSADLQKKASIMKEHSEILKIIYKVFETNNFNIKEAVLRDELKKNSNINLLLI